MIRACIRLAFFTTVLSGCNEAHFSGNTPQRAEKSPDPICTEATETCVPPPAPSCDDGSAPTDGQCSQPEPQPQPPPEEPKPEPPVCKEGAIGAQIALLIDNSTSNEATDCPGAYAGDRRKPNGTPAYVCASQTYREKAVLAAFDLLAEVAAGDSSHDEAISSLAVASFPVTDNAGFARQADWTATAAEQRETLASALGFARAPWGQTPYGEAFAAADELFKQASSDKRQRVAILVTDGFPTDGSPASVASRADALRASGVKVITIFVTGAQAREQRQSTHRAMLKRFDDATLRTAGRHWYDSGAYADFDAYVQAILALGSKVAAGDVVEIADASSLEKAVLSAVGKSLRCDDAK